jgi:hypothetical protein
MRFDESIDFQKFAGPAGENRIFWLVPCDNHVILSDDSPISGAKDANPAFSLDT